MPIENPQTLILEPPGFGLLVAFLTKSLGGEAKERWHHQNGKMPKAAVIPETGLQHQQPWEPEGMR